MEAQKKKSRLEWFKTLKFKDRIRAIEYCKANGMPLNDELPSLNEALITGFIWEETEEGQGYWSNIALDGN